MKIEIDRNTTLGKIQKVFNSEFPFLSIRFFDAQQAKENVFSKEFMINNPELTISDAGKFTGDGMIDIQETRKTSDLEKDFSDHFGVYVQVFRKAGTLWIETSTTDDYTLAEQNSLAMQKNDAIKATIPDTESYHEQE